MPGELLKDVMDKDSTCIFFPHGCTVSCTMFDQSSVHTILGLLFLSRVVKQKHSSNHHIWETDHLHHYFETRNSLVGTYSSMHGNFSDDILQSLPSNYFQDLTILPSSGWL